MLEFEEEKDTDEDEEDIDEEEIIDADDAVHNSKPKGIAKMLKWLIWIIAVSVLVGIVLMVGWIIFRPNPATIELIAPLAGASVQGPIESLEFSLSEEVNPKKIKIALFDVSSPESPKEIFGETREEEKALDFEWWVKDVPLHAGAYEVKIEKGKVKEAKFSFSVFELYKLEASETAPVPVPSTPAPAESAEKKAGEVNPADYDKVL